MSYADFYDPNTGRLTASASMAAYICRRSGSGTTRTRSGGNTNPSTILIDVSGCQYPIVALQLGGYVAGSYGRNIGTASLNLACSAPVGTNFNWFIFDWAPALPDSLVNGALLKIKNPDNDLWTFSASTWPMKLVGLLPLDGSTYQFDSASSSLAFANGSLSGHSRPGEASCYDGGQSPDPGEGLEQCRDIRYRNNGKLYGGSSVNGTRSIQTGVVSIDDVMVSAGRYQDYERDNRGWESPGNLMIIDVTNIPVGRTFF